MATATKEAPKGKKAETETSAPTKDVFGSRPGTIHHDINMVLLEHAKKKPIKMKEIMEKSGAEQTHYNHMKALERKGFVIKTAPGSYQLSDGVKATKGKKGSKSKKNKAEEPAETNPDTNSQPTPPADVPIPREDAPATASSN